MAKPQSSYDFEPYEIDGKTWQLPPTWKDQAEGFQNFQPKPDDVWVVTYPRSGTTVTQELVWLLANDLDFETAKKFHLLHRSPELPASLFPYLWENCELIRPSIEDPNVLESVPVDTSKPSYEVYKDARSPRIIKTHLALSVHKNLLNSGCKIVYTLRNTKDVLVSYSRFVAGGSNPFYKGGVQKFMETFIREDYQPYGLYWEHVKEAWALRGHPNFLLLHYEELRADLPAAIKKMANFLGKNYTDEQLARVAEHLDIETFRKNPMVNDIPGFDVHVPAFIGQGHVSGWREIVTPEFEAEIDRWIEKNTKDSDIKEWNFKK